MPVQDIVYSYIQRVMASLVLIELQTAPQVKSDVGRHLKVVDRGEILQWNLVRLPNQKAPVLPGGHRLPMPGLVGEECVQGYLTTFVLGDRTVG